MTSVPKEPVEEPEEKTKDLNDRNADSRPASRSTGSLKTIKTTRSDMAKFYLKFPKINKAYKHLFKGWCLATGQSCKEGASARDIFNLQGPLEKASRALSLAGINMTNEQILKALDSETTSPRTEPTLRFKDIILAICWTLKEDGMLDPIAETKAKYDEIIFGFNTIKEMFAQIDVDGSGEISLQEFTEAFADLSHGDDNSTTEKRMAELDFNNDKEISYPEFCVGMSVWVGFVDEFE